MVGTDGRDGRTDAAGALVDDQTTGRIRGVGLEPAPLLANHDSYRALAVSGDLIRCGPTCTNVGDPWLLWS